jgi:hypothetical protein
LEIIPQNKKSAVVFDAGSPPALLVLIDPQLCTPSTRCVFFLF